MVLLGPSWEGRAIRAVEVGDSAGMLPLPGSAIFRQNHALPGTTAFAAELPAGKPGDVATARSVWAVAVSRGS